MSTTQVRATLTMLAVPSLEAEPTETHIVFTALETPAAILARVFIATYKWRTSFFDEGVTIANT